jgi:hypothetical protein
VNSFSSYSAAGRYKPSASDQASRFREWSVWPTKPSRTWNLAWNRKYFELDVRFAHLVREHSSR